MLSKQHRVSYRINEAHNAICLGILLRAREALPEALFLPLKIRGNNCNENRQRKWL